MLNSTNVICMDGGIQYSPSFGRGALDATFTVEVKNISLAGGNFKFKVESRAGDSATWSTDGTSAAITGAGVYTLDVSGVNEVVRIGYEFSDLSASNAVALSMHAPIWRE